MLKSFACLLNDSTHTLILGTMPGEASLAAQEYYAHPRNAFWRIVADIFNQGVAFNSYQDKTSCLLLHGIGLWDNLQCCERKGSLDSNIQNGVPNDFETLLQNHSQITTVLFNGQKSFAFFSKYHSELLKKINWQILPSTSPANARLNYAEKLSAWRQAVKQ